MNEKNLHLSLPLQISFTESAAVPCEYRAISKLITVLVLKLFSGSLISLKALAIKKKSKRSNKRTHFYTEVSNGQTALGVALVFGLLFLSQSQPS